MSSIKDSALAHADSLDEQDDLAGYRGRFAIPTLPDGSECVYLCGNSLGLMPRDVPGAIQRELDDWARMGVAGHFDAETPWYSYHEVFRDTGAHLVGGLPGEVVMMNSLTVNLHLMMASFYRPNAQRYKVLIEESAFPSDRYAVMSHVRFRGYDPSDAVIVAAATGGDCLTSSDVTRVFEAEGDSIALVMMSGVNFVTGQLFDMEKICALGHDVGCTVGFDLAHAAGNVPLELHDWNVDFAVWCSYKYLNAGPGAVAGCFVHERHGRDVSVPRLAGWWGNDPDSRFQMHRDFTPRPGADGWQLSNPPILAMAPLRVSLDMFDEVGMPALRRKSERLSEYLISLLAPLEDAGVSVITPRDRAGRGCQASLRVDTRSDALVAALGSRGIVVDHRPPDIVRVAPVPFYNSFKDVMAFVHTLANLLDVNLSDVTFAR